MTCPAPMYFLGDKYLGTYSNDMSLASVTTNEDNFGLDDYEPLFFYPLPEWSEFDELLQGHLLLLPYTSVHDRPYQALQGW